MNGATDIETALIDSITEHVRDIKQDYTNAKTKAGSDAAAVEAAKAAFVSKTLPEWLGKLETVLDGTGGFAVGGNISLADVTINQLITSYFDDKDGTAAAAAAFPKISSSIATVNDAAAAWLASRPDTKM